jgi:hypothetical protein
MHCPRWIRLVVFALVLLLAAPSAAPQSTIANVCNTAWDFSQVRRINPSPYLNPHAPAPQRPGITP